MDVSSRQGKQRAAFGQAIAAYRPFRALKKQAMKRRARGEPEETTKAWLCERVAGHITEFDRLGGANSWLAGWLYEWAVTGEPGPLFEGSVGQVIVQDEEIEGQRVQIVVVAANALSDTRGLAEDFLKACDQTFPHASRKSFDHPHEAGRWFRLHREGVSWADLARQKVRKERPDLDEDSASFLELVGMERKAIREYTRRWWQEYGYKIAEILLPDLEE